MQYKNKHKEKIKNKNNRSSRSLNPTLKDEPVTLFDRSSAGSVQTQTQTLQGVLWSRGKLEEAGRQGTRMLGQDIERGGIVEMRF
jgi:hypothetical protein